MRRRDKQSKGFSLIEAAVAIGVIAILAAAAAPLVMKALNQQREAKTRESLKIAFEAIFGSRDKRVANMRSDFGFAPPAILDSMPDLRFLTNRTAPPSGANPVLYPMPVGQGAFSIGWNGPYWSGSTRQAGGQAIPVDGWGKPMRLRYFNNGYRVESMGRDGQFGTTDDLFYPNAVAPLSQFSCTPKITITNNSLTTDYTLNVQIESPNRAAATQTNCVESGTTNQSVVVGKNKNSKTFTLPAGTTNLPHGPIQFVVNITLPTTSASTSRILYDFAPGDQRTIEYGIN